MGGWDYYDDTNDETWFTLKYSILPPQLERKYQGGNNDDQVDEYMKQHPKKMYKAILKEINILIEKEKEYSITEPEMYYVGLAVRAARFFSLNKSSNNHLPNSLPENYPSKLRKIGLKYAKIMLDRLESGENRLQWVRVKDRKSCLRKEIQLFSNNS